MKRFFLGLLATFFSLSAFAAEAPFDQAQFDKLIAQGKPVIVDFFADWCPTCKTQRPIVKELANDPSMKNVTIFIADYDKEKELKKQLKVIAQSTFVVFKDGKEVTRSIGQTKKYQIEATFLKAI